MLSFKVTSCLEVKESRVCLACSWKISFKCTTVHFTWFVISRLTHPGFFFRLRLLLPTAQKTLEFVYPVVAHPHPGEGVVRTGTAGRKTCPTKEDVGFIHHSEAGCTKQIQVKVSQGSWLRMFRSKLNVDLLRVHDGFFYVHVWIINVYYLLNWLFSSSIFIAFLKFLIYFNLIF